MQALPFALFDFDNTLARGDSIVPFLLYCVRRGKAPWYQLFKAVHGFLQQKRCPDKVSHAKAQTLSFMAGMKQEEINELARSFWRNCLSKRLYADAVEEMCHLKEAGYYVLVVSASPSVYMDVLPEFLPADGVIATTCGMDEQGCFNGLVGENCKELQKPLRIAAYLAAKHLVLLPEKSCAYGDSKSDVPMLSLVSSPVLVNPKAEVKAMLPNAKVVTWR